MSAAASSNLQTLGVLLERAEAQRDEAQRQLLDVQQRAAAARNQHAQLNQYRGDYQQRWSQQFARQATMDIVGCYKSFGDRLDQAIDSQGHVAQHAEQRVERARENLRELEMRVAAIRKLIERRSLEAQRKAQRQEQKAVDEQAARAALAGFGNNPFVRLSA
ncbi:flagellar export protein FliJ [Roseateles violae]|uniref:Flagellar FliJ protein n=1 Tax=Roseateles violae TaxID=3058042 RepID=A0ABT8DRS5_9BURK|nr:flagellar export protein FliJ [Pelomonas sp. PFR6]MDN3919768.1 flagellar export protein FliJ [Pelomonas sp. PFR6]